MDGSNGMFPDHLTGFWDGLSDPLRAIIHGRFWLEPTTNHRKRVMACVRLFQQHQLSLEDAILLARFEDGLNPRHIPILRECWNERVAEQAEEIAKRVAEHKRIAEFFSISDAAWEPDHLPRRPWLAPPYLMRGQLTLPHGPGGGGKSQLAIAWAIALALGRAFGRLEPVQRARVVLTNFEDNADEQRRRISAALAYFGASPVDLVGWLHRVCMGPRSDATMFALDDNGAVGVTDCWETFGLACGRIEPDAIFLDPLVAVNAVPEADNIMMRRVMVLMRNGLAQRFNAAVVPMHHDNKAGGDDDSSDQNNVRGGTDIVNAVRFELAVKKMTVAQAEDMGIELDRRGYYFRLGSVASKLNYSAPEESEWFQRHAVAVGGEEVVRCEPWQPPTARINGEQTATIIAAVERGTDGGPYSPQLGNTDRSLSRVLEAAGIATAAVQRRVLRSLMNSGQIIRGKWWRSGKRDWRAGLRSKDGHPLNYKWQDGEDDG